MSASPAVVGFEPIDLAALKRRGNVFTQNEAASVIDLGDRIGLIEFHTKANTFTRDLCAVILSACLEGHHRFDALVLGNRGRHFSAGANLPSLLSAARERRWADVELTLHAFQDAGKRLKHGPLPVVSAPFSNTLGAGCEVCQHSARIVAAEETRMGLVETRVGLIPAGGGTKELVLRAFPRVRVEPSMESLRRPFELITRPTVARSGSEARRIFLREGDQVVSGTEGPLEIAKQVALGLVASGYRNPEPRMDVPVLGRPALQQFQAQIDELRYAKIMTEHDAIIASHVGAVLCGGDLMPQDASEQHFLDLEREAFLALLGTRKTQERIAYFLGTHQRLRN